MVPGGRRQATERDEEGMARRIWFHESERDTFSRRKDGQQW